MAEPEEKSEAKWAAETFAFLRLFVRVKDTIYGLLLVEILWACLLLLAEKVTPEAAPADARFVLTQSALHALLLPGAIVVFLLWASWSRWILYPWFMLRALARVTVKPLLFVLMFVLAFAISLLTLPYDLFRWRQWLRQMPFATKLGYARKQKAKPVRKVFSFSNGPLMQEFWSDRREKDFFVLDLWAMQTAGAVAAKLISHTRVALAPFAAHTYAEDLNAAKAPPQIFFAAIARMRTELRHLHQMQYIRFALLPVHWVPKDFSSARWLRWLLGFDVVLWGNYIGDGASTLLLNLESRDSTLPAADERTRERESAPDIFPYRFEPRFHSLLVNQADAWSVYVLSVLTLIATVQAKSPRERERKGRDRLGLRKLADWFGRSWQAFNIHAIKYNLRDAGEHLVFDAFTALPEAETALPSARDRPWPDPRQLLIALAGDWVGAQLRDDGLRSVHHIEALAFRLMPVVHKCIGYAPDIPENYYRLGALELLLGHGDDAVAAFERAAWYERSLLVEDKQHHYFAALADMALKDWGRRSSDMALVRYVVLAARAVNLGGEAIKSALKESQEKDVWFSIVRKTSESYAEARIKLAVLDRILGADYRPARNRHDVEGLAQLLAVPPQTVRETLAGSLEPAFIATLRRKLDGGAPWPQDGANAGET